MRQVRQERPTLDTLEGRLTPAEFLSASFAYDPHELFGFVGVIQDAYGTDSRGRPVHALAGQTEGNGPRVVVVDNGPSSAADPLSRDAITGAGDVPRVLYSWYAFEPEFRGGVLIEGYRLPDGQGSPGEYGLAVAPRPGGAAVVRRFHFDGTEQAPPLVLADESFRGGVSYIDGTDWDGREYLIAAAGPGGGPVLTYIDLDTGRRLDFLMAAADDRSGAWRPIPAGARPVPAGPDGDAGVYVSYNPPDGPEVVESTTFLDFTRGGVLVDPDTFPHPSGAGHA